MRIKLGIMFQETEKEIELMQRKILKEKEKIKCILIGSLPPSSKLFFRYFPDYSRIVPSSFQDPLSLVPFNFLPLSYLTLRTKETHSYFQDTKDLLQITMVVEISDSTSRHYIPNKSVMSKTHLCFFFAEQADKLLAEFPQ